VATPQALLGLGGSRDPVAFGAAIRLRLINGLR
jgi:hypothetical protein